MNKTNTVVFDSETFAVASHRAVIASLSGVKFDRFANKAEPEHFERFHAVLYVTEQIYKGRVIEASCIEWWNKPSNMSAKAAILDLPHQSCKQAVLDFVEFIEGCQVFCRGTDFDPPKLLSLAADFGVKVPVKYNAWRDVRTYIDAFLETENGYLEGFEMKGLTAHNSLDDCIRDACQMIEARLFRVGELPTEVPKMPAEPEVRKLGH